MLDLVLKASDEIFFLSDQLLCLLVLIGSPVLLFPTTPSVSFVYIASSSITPSNSSELLDQLGHLTKPYLTT